MHFPAHPVKQAIIGVALCGSLILGTNLMPIGAPSPAHAQGASNLTMGVADGGFETPSVGPAGAGGSFAYNPTGGPWTFSGNSGIAANGSGFTSGNPNAPEGVQVAFLQRGDGSVGASSSSTIAQPIFFAEPQKPYTLSFQAAQRNYYSQAGQDFAILLDGHPLGGAAGVVKPAGQSYMSYTVPITPTAAVQRLTFAGRDSAGGDNTAFIDDVHVGLTTVTTVTAAPDPAIAGQPVTVVATVRSLTPDLATPTGTVTLPGFGSGTLNADGQASISYTAPSAGIGMLIDASYSGNIAFGISQSSTIMVPTVAGTLATETTLSASPNPSIAGQVVTVVATVRSLTSGSGTPTGTVTFTGPLGSATLDANGQARIHYTAPGDSVGEQFGASYGGDTTFSGSESNFIFVPILQPSTTVVTSSNPAAVYGQTVTFTATMTAPGSLIPTGSVTFKDGAVTLGTFATTIPGIARLTTSSLRVGAHSITASYGGSSNFIGSTSAALTQPVNRAGATTSLSSSANPSTAGQTITFTARVLAHAPGSGIPTGAVTFIEGATDLTTATLNAGGLATLTTSALTGGTHSITAVYGGNASFAGSTSAALSQVVHSLSASTTSLSSSANPSAFGQTITVTARVLAVAPGSGIPAGTVTFMDSIDGATDLTTVTLNAGGLATLTTSALTGGTHSITAAYGGSASFAGSTSAALSQVVSAPPASTTTTTLTSESNPSAVGQSVTLIAHVTAAPNHGYPEGMVTFKDGATTLGTAFTWLQQIAELSTSSLSMGTHSITAVFDGDDTFAGSTSAALSQVVYSASGSTTIRLTSSSNPSMVGQPVTFTAHVTGSGTPSGTVTFEDGTDTLGTGTLSSGIATLTTSALVVGTYSIMAVYGGSGTFGSSTSATLFQTVNRDATTTTLTSSSSDSILGQTITFTARVAAVAPGSGIPTGAVIFMDGATELSMGTLNASGSGRFTTWALALGTHSITAVYGESGTFAGSTSAILTQTVYKVSSDWALCAGENGTCSFIGTRTVAYGANGLYTYRTVTTSTACNDGTFGNPIPNTVKACYSTPLPDPNVWTQCAPENGSCSFAGIQVVAYGANGQFAYRAFTNGTACNNSIFGDPAPNTVKACYALSQPG